MKTNEPMTANPSIIRRIPGVMTSDRMAEPVAGVRATPLASTPSRWLNQARGDIPGRVPRLPRAFTSPGSLLPLAIAAIAMSCASTPKPNAGGGTPYDLSRIVGEWHGEYSSAATGLNGSILFVLEAARGPAYGEVLMIPNPDRAALPRSEAARPDELPSRRILTVAVVKVEGSEMEGTLEPYRDPECGCLLWTTFTGRLLSYDAAEGTFASRGPSGHPEQTGVWTASRMKERRYAGDELR